MHRHIGLMPTTLLHLTAILMLMVSVSFVSAGGAENLPPLAQIISPTNHTEFRWSDGVGLFLVAVHVADPEGSVEQVQVQVNDRTITTNRLGDYELDFGHYQPESGQIKVTVTDDHGLIATDTITFTAVQEPWFPGGLLQIYREGDHLIIMSSGTGAGFLQESSDWVQWSNVARLDTNQFVIIPSADRRFYRVRVE
jgi:hypothetical protein